MRSETLSEEFVQNLLLAMPSWHFKLVRPFKEMLSKEMSLETYYCLETLRTCGTATMTELARQMKVPKQQITKLIDKLYGHGFVERVPDPDDRRVISIRLTPEASVYLNGYYRKNEVFLRMLEEQLSCGELEELNAAVQVLGQILPKLE